MIFQVRPDGRRALALAVRAVVAVPHRRPGQGPRLGPARHRRRGGPRAAVWNCTPGSTRTGSPTTPTSTRLVAIAPRAQAPRLGRAVRREALLQPRAARGPRASSRTRCSTRSAVRRSTPSTGTTTSTRTRSPARSSTTTPRTRSTAAASPDRAAWRRDNIDRLVRETADRHQEDPAGTQFGISPFGVWRNAATDPLGSDTRAGVQTYDDLHADTRKLGPARAGSTTSVPQIYWNIGFAAADYAKLRALVGRGRRGHGRRAVRRRGALQGRRPGAARGLAGPGRTVPPSHLRRGTTPRSAGTSSSPPRRSAADRIGAMARVVADHYQQPAKPPR